LCLQYSFSLTTFSPSGKLVQIEYALNAVAAGATSLGIACTDGVVIATEKKLPSILVDESTVQKILMLTPNIGVVYSGMGPDYRVLVRKARKTAQAYYRLYHEHIPVAQLVREVAAVMQEFTREWEENTQQSNDIGRTAGRQQHSPVLEHAAAANGMLAACLSVMWLLQGSFCWAWSHCMDPVQNDS
jgi:hypothetical protein